MCANIDVDQGAARDPVLLRDRARAAGIADDRMVFLHAAAESSRPLLRHRARHAHALARHRRGHRRCARRGRHRRRRRRPVRSLFVLPLRGAGRGEGTRHCRERRSPLDGHRRARVRRRAGEQLPDARDRADGRRAARRPRQLRAHDRARLVHHEARGRRVVDCDRPRPVSAASTLRRPKRGSMPNRPARPAGLVDGDCHDRGDVGRVRPRRHGRESAIVTLLTDDGRRAIARAHATSLLATALTTEAWEGRRVRITNDGSANSIAE